jgi:hypothetical protein
MSASNNSDNWDLYSTPEEDDESEEEDVEE